MRRGLARFTLFVVLAGSALAGCGDDEPPPELPASSAFAPEVKDRLAAIYPVVATEVVYQYPANIDEPLQHLHAGWSKYLQQLEVYLGLRGLDGRLVKAIQDDGSATYDAVCQAKTLPSPVPTSLERPLYCRTVEVVPNAVPQTGLVILPVDFTERLRGAVEGLSEQDQRWVAGIIASKYYLDHLVREAADAGILWPRGDLFDWCLVGVGMRTLTKMTVDPDELRPLLKIVANLIGAPPFPIYATEQIHMIRIGYVNGRPEMCVYDPTTVSR
jgi:hypothetical protein